MGFKRFSTSTSWCHIWMVIGHISFLAPVPWHPPQQSMCRITSSLQAQRHRHPQHSQTTETLPVRRHRAGGNEMVVHFLPGKIAMVTYAEQLACSRAGYVRDNRSTRIKAPPTDQSKLGMIILHKYKEVTVIIQAKNNTVYTDKCRKDVLWVLLCFYIYFFTCSWVCFTDLVIHTTALFFIVSPPRLDAYIRLLSLFSLINQIYAFTSSAIFSFASCPSCILQLQLCCF